MKKITLVLCTLSLCTFFVACSDKVYEEINTDPTKAAHINPASQLTYAELQMFGDMNYVDVHRLYTYAFTQQLMGCWNTTNYGGQHRMDDNEMSRPWANLYPGAIRNLTDAIEQTKSDPAQANIHAALRVFRVYVGGLLTDYYGDVPFTQAGLGYITGNTQPKYDKQDDLYAYFFAELKAAAALFDINANAISSDPMFNGNIDGWKRFANSLRTTSAAPWIVAFSTSGGARCSARPLGNHRMFHVAVKMSARTADAMNTSMTRKLFMTLPDGYRVKRITQKASSSRLALMASGAAKHHHDDAPPVACSRKDYRRPRDCRVARL